MNETVALFEKLFGELRSKNIHTEDTGNVIKGEIEKKIHIDKDRGTSDGFQDRLFDYK